MKSVGVLTTDRALVVRGWDAWLTNATGVSEDRALGVALCDLFPEIAERNLDARLRTVLAEGTVDVLAPAFHHYLIRCAVPAATPYFDAMQQHVTISPLRDARGISGLAITIEDVTARCVQERELAAHLQNEDDEIRLRAARAISEDAVDPAPLLDVLGDANWQVRRAAVQGIAQRSDEELVARLVEAVRNAHEDLGLLNSALSALTMSKADAVPALLSTLEHGDPNVRMYTALTLGNLHDPRGVPALIGLLADEDINVRYHAIEALGRIGSADGVFALIEVVEQRDPYLSFVALDALAAIGEPAAAAAVAGLLDDPLLAGAAVDALGAFGNEQVIARMAQLLHADEVPAGALCRAFARIAHRLQDEYGEGQLVADLVKSALTAEARARIVRSIRNASDDELAAIAEVLGWLDAAGVEQTLAALLRHGRARKAAQQALVRVGARATSVLVDELAADDAGVRRAAADALGCIGDRSAVPALTRLLDDPDGDVLIAVAAALGAIGDYTAFEPLLQLLPHPDAAVRAAAVSAINSIGHPETARHITPLLTDEDPATREGAIRIAGYFGYRECLDLVIALTRDPDEHVRRAAVEHLAFFESPAAAAAITEALEHGTPAVRAVAARSLTHLNPGAAEQLIHAALADADARVRYHAAQAAGAQRIADAMPRLRVLLEDDAAMPVRIAAAQALGDLRDEGAATALAKLISHEETDLACAAIRAIAKLSTPLVSDALRIGIRSGDVRRQLAVLEALAQGSPPELLRDLRWLAERADSRPVARAALAVLARTGTSESIDAALALTTDAGRRADCIAALSQVSETVVGRVAKGLRHPDPRVRRATVESLARMKRAAASRALTFSLADEDPTVQFATVQALGRLDMMV